jgi:hypothetical protein
MQASGGQPVMDERPPSGQQLHHTSESERYENVPKAAPVNNQQQQAYPTGGGQQFASVSVDVPRQPQNQQAYPVNGAHQYDSVPGAGPAPPSQHPNADFGRFHTETPNHARDNGAHYQHTLNSMSQQGAKSNAPPPTQTRSGVPREYQLEAAFVLPSVNYDLYGRPVVESGNDFVSMTPVVAPGIKECFFYTPIANFAVDFQVVRGGTLDIGLFIKDPSGEPIVIRPPAPDGSFSVIVLPQYRLMPYAICLDNRKASYAEKHVAVTIDLDINWDNPNEYERAAIEFMQRRSMASGQTNTANAELMENWRIISTQLDGLLGRIRHVERLQQRSNNFGSVDKALMEANHKRVTNGSIVQVLLMVGVSLTQLLLIRSLFDSNSRFYRIWFGKPSSTAARC